MTTYLSRPLFEELSVARPVVAELADPPEKAAEPTQAPVLTPERTPELPPVLPLAEPLPVLEYHAPVDDDAELVAKAVGCFAGGALAMGIGLNFFALVLLASHMTRDQIIATMLQRSAFLLGITGAGASLLLVGLKVREHTAEVLHARHLLAALATGAAFSAMVWGPWLIAEQGVTFNRFVAASIWMALMAFPAVAARWVVGR